MPPARRRQRERRKARLVILKPEVSAHRWTTKLLRPVGVDMRPIRHDYDRDGDAGLSCTNSKRGLVKLIWQSDSAG
jgi:hypothetical protein